MSRHEPEVTVADSNHLLVEWTGAFENCESGKVQSATVEYRTFPKYPEVGKTLSINVTFDDKKAKVEANPCLKHSFKVKMKYEGYGFDVVSHHSSYNAFNSDLRIEDLYSGLLQKQVVGKICIRKGGLPSLIPDIPEEISNCVTFKRINTKKITLKILDPQNEAEKVEIQEDLLECSRLNEGDNRDGELHVDNEDEEVGEIGDKEDGELQEGKEDLGDKGDNEGGQRGIGKAHNDIQNGTDSSSSNETVGIAIGASVLVVLVIIATLHNVPVVK